MPTVLRIGSYRFHFYSDEGNEPPHIHVATEPTALKAWAEDRTIYLELTDGRIFGFPADRFKILKQASTRELK